MPADARPWQVTRERLAAARVSPQQVQIVWVKLANKGPAGSLEEHGRKLERDTLALLHNARALFPNLRLAYLNSRIYGGYATTDLNPEPYAYESGLAVKWLIEAQIRQMAAAGRPPGSRAGDLNYYTVAPWLAWGPYLWAEGLNPRSDGLFWERSDLAVDGTHPSTSGQAKVGGMLPAFFKQSTETRCWFLAGGRCG